MTDVIVGAGGAAKSDDGLIDLVTEGRPKVLAEMAGKPMVQWVLDAIAATDRVNNVVIIGLDTHHGLNCGDKTVHYIPSAGSIIDNVSSGITKLTTINPDSRIVLWASGDLPLITSAMLNWFLDRTEETGCEFYYQIIEQGVMEGRFPGSNRTFTRINGNNVCGGDVSAFSTSIASGANPAWRKISSARKSIIRQAAIVGLWPLVLLVAGQMTKERAAMIVRKRLGVDGLLIECPYAEMGMDVDKADQYEIVNRELEARLDNH